MTTLLKKSIFIIIGILIIGVVIIALVKSNTKTYSPEETITFISKENITFSVFYNRPYKKKRKIFGELVPFDQVWRTGANEPTTFTTSKDVFIDGTLLKAGTYSLWTIPNENSWKVIFNGQEYDWGISFIDDTASREPEYDVLTLEVPVIPLLNIVEQFSIYFEEANDFSIMYLAWDQTAIAIPIKP